MILSNFTKSKRVFEETTWLPSCSKAEAIFIGSLSYSEIDLNVYYHLSNKDHYCFIFVSNVDNDVFFIRYFSRSGKILDHVVTAVSEVLSDNCITGLSLSNILKVYSVFYYINTEPALADLKVQSIETFGLTSHEKLISCARSLIHFYND